MGERSERDILLMYSPNTIKLGASRKYVEWKKKERKKS